MKKYKEAPTWLYRGEEAKLFNEQKEVDAAWNDGWYGPPGLIRDKPLISKTDFSSAYGIKQRLIDDVASDPRYGGLKLDKKRTVDELYTILERFEFEVGLRTGSTEGSDKED